MSDLHNLNKYAFKYSKGLILAVAKGELEDGYNIEPMVRPAVGMMTWICR